MSIHLLLPTVSIAANLALLAVLFTRPVRMPGRLAFAGFLGTLVLWSAAQLGMGLADTPGVAETWHELLTIATMLYVPLYLRFTERFTGRKVDRRLFGFVVAAAGVGAVLSMRGLLVERMVPAPVGYAPHMSVWFVSILPALYIGGIVGLHNLWQTMNESSSPAMRNRAGYLVVGSVAMLLFGSVDVISSVGLANVYVSTGGNLVFAIFATAAILNDRIVDLRKLVRRQLGHLLLVGIIGGATIGFITLADTVINDISPSRPVVAMVTVLVFAFVSPLLHDRAHRWVDAVWYGKRARSLGTLKDFAAHADSVHDMELLGATMVYIVREAARAAHVTLVERVPGRHLLRAAASVGTDVEMAIAFPDDGALAQALRTSAGALPMSELRESPAWLSVPAPQRRTLEESGVDLIVPIVFNDSVAGALMIGPRLDKKPYPQEETELLVSIARQVAPAIENARLYEELRAQIKELKETQVQLVQAGKLATLGTLASGVAHEISNPLFSILGRVELLRRDADRHLASSRAIEYVDSIHEMSVRISDIVKALLTFSRRDSALGPIDIHRLMNDTIGLVERDLALSRISVVRNFAPGAPYTVGNPAKLKQALMNIVLNAKDAMPGGGTITLSTAVDHGEVRISCADTGRGIPEESIPRVFDAFFTTKDRGLGAGLGLYICNSIVDEHGGHIAVESAVGVGTTISIALPEETQGAQSDIGAALEGFHVVGAPIIEMPAYQAGGSQ